MIDLEALGATRRRNLHRLLFPRSIAVVGASKDPAKAGYHALATLSGFDGTIYAINPKETDINGAPCFADISALPGPVDLAILAVPATACSSVLTAAAEKGVGGVFIISGGFGETGEAGQALQDELAAICAETGVRLLGPNTSGFINPRAHCSASFVHRVSEIGAGRVAVVAQSGGVNLSLCFLLRQLGEGVSLAVGIGNGADVDASDVLDQLCDDPATTAIALHLEGVKDGRRLMKTLTRITKIKPVCAVVAGRNDIGEFAQSHTGNLLGARDRTVAALEDAGVVIVDTLEELAQAAAVLAGRRLSPCMAPGVALVTGQAGPGLLVVDGLKSAGLNVPALSPETEARLASLLPPMTFIKNPVDTGRPGETFPAIMSAVSRDPAVDLVLAWGLVEPAVLDPADAVADMGKPVIFGVLGIEDDVATQRRGLTARGVPLVTSPERLVLAARALCDDARAQARRARSAVLPDPRKSVPISTTLDEDGAKALLSDYGIAVPMRQLCKTHEAAQHCLVAMDGPVVVKIVAKGLLHKSDVGGVHLGIETADGLRAALDAIDAIPVEGLRSYLVEQMAAPGMELIVGGTNDPVWGPVLLVGMGGVLAEALEDVVVRVGPVALDTARDMLGALRLAPLFHGFRGQPHLDVDAAARAIVAVGAVLRDHPEIREMEVNPFRLFVDGGVALDAVVVT